jgi:Fe2+ or Zn2+ uptake regulation protein
MSGAASDEEVEQAVLEYLRMQPEAGDTLEGIASWWIARQRVQIGVQAVARALNRLTERGLIEATQRSDRPWYRLVRSIGLAWLCVVWGAKRLVG